MANEVNLLPWQTGQFDQMKELVATARLGHAWLLTGVQGIGKLGFARYLTHYLFCQQAEAGIPCGTCTSCHLLQVGTHPDFRLLQPEKKLITIDQIRDSIEFAHNTSQRGTYKILCFSPAEAMNNNAANALLKLLEEPPKDTILFLISHQPGLLLPTMRSRCQQMRMQLPDLSTATAWLEAQGYTGNAAQLLHKAAGAPLQALALTESGVFAEQETIMSCLQDVLSGTSSPVKAAKKCEKMSIEATIDYLMQCLSDMLGSLQTGNELAENEVAALLQLLPQGRDLPQRLRILHKLYQALGAVRKTLMSSNNPNPLLILEQVFGDWSKLRYLLNSPARNNRQAN